MPTTNRTIFGTLACVTLLAGCGQPPAPRADDTRLEELSTRLEERFTPGLHTLMGQLADRHALVWFAGEAQNWPLAAYMVHELEELVEDIAELHPVYHEVMVADLLQGMTRPATEALAAAVAAGDLETFERSYDDLTAACNGCHVAADRPYIVVRRPDRPPLANLRFEP